MSEDNTINDIDPADILHRRKERRKRMKSAIIEGFEVDTDDIANEREKKKANSDFKKASTSGKISIMLKEFSKGVIKWLQEIIVFITAVVTVLFLYVRMTNEEFSYPSEVDKYPYVFVEDHKDYKDQKYLTTTRINSEASFTVPMFRQIKPQFSSNNNGSVFDHEKTKETINQPSDAKPKSINTFAKFFNKVSRDKMYDEINLIQIISFVLLYGITSSFEFFNSLFDTIKTLSFVNPQDNESVMSKVMGVCLTLTLIIILFFMFRISKDDLKKYLLVPFVNNTSNKNMPSGVFTIMGLISALFSGFFSILKLSLFLFYLVFMIQTPIALLHLMTNLGSMYSISVVGVMIFSFIVNAIFILSSLYEFQNGNKSSNLIDTVVASMFSNVASGFNSFKKIMKSLNMFNVENVGSDFKSTLIFVIMLPIMMLMMGIFSIPILLIVYFIIFSIIPLIASLYAGFTLSYGFTMEGFKHLTGSVKKEFITHYNYIGVCLALLVCSFLIVSPQKVATIGDLLQLITSLILSGIVIILMLFVGTLLSSRDVNNKTASNNDKDNNDNNIKKSTIATIGTKVGGNNSQNKPNMLNVNSSSGNNNPNVLNRSNSDDKVSNNIIKKYILPSAAALTLLGGSTVITAIAAYKSNN
jgi:hypothetical protein